MGVIFVTGTDTGVGKTFVGCALAHAWRAAGRTVGVVKPVETGVDGEPEDARALDGLVAMQADLRPDRAGVPGRQLEPCPEIVARTAGLEPISDDNMGSEWRIVFGLE